MMTSVMIFNFFKDKKKTGRKHLSLDCKIVFLRGKNTQIKLEGNKERRTEAFTTVISFHFGVVSVELIVLIALKTIKLRGVARHC
jgi:hypothetical protein